jgi:hypothetical protein
MTPAQQAISDAAFFFVRNVLLARSNGYSNELTSTGNQNRANLLTEFSRYLAASGNGEKFSDANESFAATRLEYELALAKRGETQASRILLANDDVVLTAISTLPKAKELAMSSLKHRSAK